MSPKQLAVHALECLRGDDYARATMAFKGLSKKDMQKEYGHSGKTCQQILDEYAARNKRIDDAIAWVKSCKEEP